MSRTLRIFCALTVATLGFVAHGAAALDSPTVQVRTTGAVALPGDARLEHQAELARQAVAQRERDAEAALQAEQAAAAEAKRAAAVTSTTAPPAPTTTVTAQPRAPGSNYQKFERLGDCESGERWYDEAGHVHFVEGSANWSLNTGNGYYGGIQFSAATWRQAGGTGLPHEHSKDHQIAIAESWLAKTNWAQWPDCSKDLGYR